MMPHWTSDDEGPLSEFSTKRALKQVEAISKQPHYVGSENHEIVANYLLKELNKLGLETSIQEGYTLSDWENLVKSKNILARIKGTNSSKALLLLSHYDSAPHSYSPGASDAGSGVATILESVRAFLYTKTPHKNDIIILFSDAEELGLNGAALFVTQHQWAKEVGLVLNFEARGSSGPSYMLMETNKGNAGLVKEFAAANATFPVSNSLMYSIYKMLPNDTDLTVFREQGNIQGYNFAFIDDHFNYHTAQDDINHLSKNTLTHQGSYLIPLLNYFSNADLKTTQASEDYVYFTIPYTFISYPFSWILPMVIVALALFIFLLFLGKAKRILSFREIGKGFIPFLGSLTVTGLITFLGWKALLKVYPQYNDLLNGFTYNGHAYIPAFVLLALAISLAFYQRFSAKKVTMNHYVVPLFLWIVINGILAFVLRGAGFLIIPVYFGLFIFGVFIVTQRSNKTLNLVCSIPALIIIAPFIQMFPIGLGLKVLFGSAILTVLTFSLLLPVFGAFAKKGIWSFVFFILAIGFFAKAHSESGYEFGKAKSNSLLYIFNADTNQANWVTYDTNLDSWTKGYLGENPKEATAMEDTPLPSKYNSKFTYQADAPIKVLEKPTIAFLEDRIVGNQRYLKIKISPNRNVNRYDIFANEKMTINNFRANGVTSLGQKGSKYERNGKKILSYYVVDNMPLEMQFSVNAATILDMELMESSFDLMTNPLFGMAKRENWMMPTPFVLNDAVIIKQKIKPSPKLVTKPLDNAIIDPAVKDSLTVVKDSLM
ncbi:M28 family peptidase [Flavobacterium gawalongense]|uniref:M28 family peptidase n=1 Tax=Flavobacterium gawalongense TaxID=2594432 RepID=A0A553BWF8_9FLAO|nr:M28 family peptidase [Flavobacterium gawalongense]TRX06619.1 M28 family peptidase [Flavobacterium gawalongense]TRX12621.1 M28 family peptidase [Flavobacterium gawalongense]TRX12756.1 M28 family peptidase [Flavobacterium gawalongense]TRX30587.1 M28 family peptidase [Flavobacterium gawalongense]